MHAHFRCALVMGTIIAYTPHHGLVKYFNCRFVHMLRMFDFVQ